MGRWVVFIRRLGSSVQVRLIDPLSWGHKAISVQGRDLCLGVRVQVREGVILMICYLYVGQEGRV